MKQFIPPYHIQPFGDDAVLLSWKEEIDIQVNRYVHTLFHLLESSNDPGYVYSIPAYSSLTLVFDTRRSSYTYWEHQLNHLLSTVHLEELVFETRSLDIPVCYEPIFAPDLGSFSDAKGLSVEEVVKLHTSTEYQVFMLGFLPGFAYMGKLPESLYARRKETPRKVVPAGSVGIAGLQTGIYPSESPGGWQLIGRTPLRAFRPEKEKPFLFQPGDQVRFYSITANQFKEMATQNAGK